ncbi:protein phosphatase 2C domain-containing protein, partial [Nocardia sp. 2YAB30]|uniref:protein phosphatase 2C domain-containing protein n=1 Tax=unclassified Nocardia TaxID=2637762 RepID=UPI003F977E6F
NGHTVFGAANFGGGRGGHLFVVYKDPDTGVVRVHEGLGDEERDVTFAEWNPPVGAVGFAGIVFGEGNRPLDAVDPETGPRIDPGVSIPEWVGARPDTPPDAEPPDPQLEAPLQRELPGGGDGTAASGSVHVPPSGEPPGANAVPEVFRSAHEDLVVERAEAAAELAKAAAKTGADVDILQSERFEQELEAARRRLGEQGVLDADRYDTELRVATLHYREVAAMVRRLEELGGVSKDATPSRHRLLTKHAAAVLSRQEASHSLREAAAVAGADPVALRSVARVRTEMDTLRGRIPDAAYGQLSSALSSYFDNAESVRRLERAIAAHDVVVESRVATTDPEKSLAVRGIRNFSADQRELTVWFSWGEAGAVEAAASALGDKLRELGWRDPDQIAAAMEVVRNAGLGARRFIADFPAREELNQFGNLNGLPGMLKGSRPGGDPNSVFPHEMLRPRVQLTVRLSANADVRSLRVSVECDQVRPVGPLEEEVLQGLDELIPQHSADAVGAEVYRSLEAATRSGVETHGEVWAHFEEPRVAEESTRGPADGDEVAESLDQATRDFEAKRRIVEKLRDDHNVRLLGWEDGDVLIDALTSADRTLRQLIAEYGGKHNLREVRFLDETALRAIDPLSSAAATYYCGTRYTATHGNYYAGIAIDRRAIADPEWSAETLRHSQEETHWWGRSPGDLVSAVLRHEFGHVVDQSQGITRSGGSIRDRLEKAFDVYRSRGLIPAETEFDAWLSLLPRYAFIDGDPAKGLNDKEALAEGSKTGAEDASLPLTDPARVIHALSHGVDAEEFANTMADRAQGHTVDILDRPTGPEFDGDADIEAMIADRSAALGIDTEAALLLEASLFIEEKYLSIAIDEVTRRRVREMVVALLDRGFQVPRNWVSESGLSTLSVMDGDRKVLEVALDDGSLRVHLELDLIEGVPARTVAVDQMVGLIADWADHENKAAALDSMSTKVGELLAEGYKRGRLDVTVAGGVGERQLRLDGETAHGRAEFGYAEASGSTAPVQTFAVSPTGRRETHTPEKETIASALSNTEPGEQIAYVTDVSVAGTTREDVPPVVRVSHGEPGHRNDCVPVAFGELDRVQGTGLVDWSALGEVGPEGVSGERIVGALRQHRPTGFADRDALRHRPVGFADRDAVVQEVAGRGENAAAVLFEVYDDTGMGHAVLLVNKGDRVVVREGDLETDFEDWCGDRPEPTGVWAVVVENGEIVTGLGTPGLPPLPDGRTFGRNPADAAFGPRHGLRDQDGRPVAELGEPERAERLAGETRSAAGVSKRGAHDLNEDAMVVVEFTRDGKPVVVAAAFDGVSGAPDGHRAAQEAAAELSAYLEEHWPRARFGRGLTREAVLRDALHHVQLKVQALGRRPEYADHEDKPQCTVAVVIKESDRFTVGWVGDSRVGWASADGRHAMWLTDDHSSIPLFAKANGITESEALERSPWLENYRQAIEYALGREKWNPAEPHDHLAPAEYVKTILVSDDIDAPVIAEDGTITVPRGGVAFTVTDGAVKTMSGPQALGEVVGRHAGDRGAIAAALVDRAEANGELDDITVVVVPDPHAEGSPTDAAASQEPRRRWRPSLRRRPGAAEPVPTAQSVRATADEAGLPQPRPPRSLGDPTGIPSAGDDSSEVEDVPEPGRGGQGKPATRIGREQRDGALLPGGEDVPWVGDGTAAPGPVHVPPSGEPVGANAVPEVFRSAHEDLVVERAEAAAELAKAAAKTGADVDILQSERFEQELEAARRRLGEQGVLDADRYDTDLRAATLRYREVAAMVRRLEELGGVSKGAAPFRHRLLTKHAAAVLSRQEALQSLRKAAAAADADLVALRSEARAETEMDRLQGQIPDDDYWELSAAQILYVEKTESVSHSEHAVVAHDAVVEGRVDTSDPDESDAVQQIRSWSADQREATVAFSWGEAGAVEAAASALGDKLREWGWRDPGRIAAAMEVVRNAGLGALEFIREFPEPEELAQFGNLPGFDGAFQSARIGQPMEHVSIRRILSTPWVVLTVRWSEDADIRSLSVSVECDQYRMQGPLPEELFSGVEELVPHHSAAAVGAEVYQSLKAAERSGVEPHGEAWAHFEEPRAVDEQAPGRVDGDEVPEPPDQATRDFEAKRRVVDKLYDDHHVRLLGWEAEDVLVDAIESADRELRDLIAEYGGRHNLREVRFVDPDVLNRISENATGLASSFGTSYTATHANYYSVIEIDRRAVTDRKWSAETLQVSQETFWWGRSPGDLISHLLRHEFIHVLDRSRGITRSPGRLIARMNRAFDVFRSRGLPPSPLTFVGWSGLLPRYPFVDGDPAKEWKEQEVLAEAGASGARDASLALDDPARVAYGLSHGLDAEEFAHTMADWEQTRLRVAYGSRGFLRRLVQKVPAPAPAAEGNGAYARPSVPWSHEDYLCGPLTMQDVGAVTGRAGLDKFTAGLGGMRVRRIEKVMGGRKQAFANIDEAVARLKEWGARRDKESPDSGKDVGLLVFEPTHSGKRRGRGDVGHMYWLVRRVDADGTVRIERRDPGKGVLQPNFVPSRETAGHPVFGMFLDSDGERVEVADADGVVRTSRRDFRVGASGPERSADAVDPETGPRMDSAVSIPERVGARASDNEPVVIWLGSSRMELTPGRPVTFGRGDFDPEGRFRTRFQDLAPEHVTFGVEPDGRVWIEDLGTPGGTELGYDKIGHVRVEPGHRAYLSGHETIFLGRDFGVMSNIFRPLASAPMPAHVARGRDLLADLDYVAVAGMVRNDLPSDPGLEEIARRQRFDELPTVVDPTGVDAVVASEGREFFRGVTDPTHVDEFESGRYFAGRPAKGFTSGNGIYVTTREAAALDFAMDRPEGVIRMALRPGARVIHALDLHAEQRAVLDELRDERSRLEALPQTPDVADELALVQARFDVLSDVGRYAAVRGYDAYMTNGGLSKYHADYWVVLNRSALVVQGQGMPHPRADTDHGGFDDGGDGAMGIAMRTAGIWTGLYHGARQQIRAALARLSFGRGSAASISGLPDATALRAATSDPGRVPRTCGQVGLRFGRDELGLPVKVPRLTGKVRAKGLSGVDIALAAGGNWQGFRLVSQMV